MDHKLRVVLLAASLVCGRAFASADDSFLHQPFPSYLFKAKTYPDGVRELSQIIQKPVIIPDGVADFAKEINGWNIGVRIPVFIRIGRAHETPTLRDVLDQTSSSLGMGWTYDKTKDRVALDFSWCRNDARSGTELVRILQNTPAAVSQQDQRYYWNHLTLSPNNTWQIAFDALLSKPENSPSAWKVRLADDLKRDILPCPVINLLSAKIKDQAGSEHLIILNDQPAFMNPGEGTFCYYVFNLNGKFEQGGVYGSGWRCHDASAWTDSAQQRLTLRVFFNYAEKMDQNFILTARGLVLHDVVDDRMKSILGSDAGLISGLHMGISPLHVTN